MNSMKSNLQSAVDRYGNSLSVPDRLEKLHPRNHGNPGNAAALAPAVVLMSISAFEGFVEEFIAGLAIGLGQPLSQVAHLVNLNNPTVRDFEKQLKKLVTFDSHPSWQKTFEVNIWKPPRIGDSAWIGKQILNWDQTCDDADSWMQVRHSLSHGLTRGFRAEKWPPPSPSSKAIATRVLRAQRDGKHSLSIHGAESCAHIYRQSAKALADYSVELAGLRKLNWGKVPQVGTSLTD